MAEDGRAEAAGCLPEHSVRVSSRARRVRLEMSDRAGLVVVVPRGFDRSRIPGILEVKRPWIERVRQQLEVRRARLVADPPCLPARVVLPAVDEDWQVEYRPAAGASVRTSLGGRLLVSGDLADEEACRQALARWLVRRARAALVPWVEGLAQERGFAFARVSVRRQRSRWGSCSRRGTISLNARLLFLPPDLVEYIILHELCHTVEMNHSPRFWALLERHHAGTKQCRKRLRTAGENMPAWWDHSLGDGA